MYNNDKTTNIFSIYFMKKKESYKPKLKGVDYKILRAKISFLCHNPLNITLQNIRPLSS